jgi:hypothetical protein
MRLNGLPTILLLQITTTSFQVTSILYFSRSVIIQVGVQLAKNELSQIANFQKFCLVNQSTSFSGLIAFITFAVSICFGRGSCTINQ